MNDLEIYKLIKENKELKEKVEFYKSNMEQTYKLYEWLLKDYEKICEMLESKDKPEKHFKNKPLKFEDLYDKMWCWDNKEKEYIFISCYDNWHECYWYWCVNCEDGFKLFKDEFEENRLYRYEVKENEEF